jgi:hypothetical protein
VTAPIKVQRVLDMASPYPSLTVTEVDQDTPDFFGKREWQIKSTDPQVVPFIRVIWKPGHRGGRMLIERFRPARVTEKRNSKDTEELPLSEVSMAVWDLAQASWPNTPNPAERAAMTGPGGTC